MELLVNGKKVFIQNVKNVEDVVTHYNLQKGLVVIEVDGNIIDRNEWANTPVREGMKIEIVHFVGGG